MSIRDRLEESVLLWNNGKKHGAWIQALIAADATATRRFSSMKGVGARFKTFIKEITPAIVSGSAPILPGGVIVQFANSTGASVSLDELLYNHLRCGLVHTAETKDGIELRQSRVENGKLMGDIRGGEATASSPVVIPDFWVLHLLKAIAETPENATECSGFWPPDIFHPV